MEKNLTLPLTLLFPGQGSQYIGMGKELKEEDPLSYSYFQKADEILGYSLSALCLEGPADQLKLTENTQPAILTHSLAIYSKLERFLKTKTKKRVQFQRVLGHSVGEYAALVVAKAISFEDAVMAVHLRGKFMQEAVPQGLGKMVAILRANEDLVLQACQEVSRPDSLVCAANFNEPQQIVLSGHVSACDRAVEWLQDKSEGKIRAIELTVSAPFHSPLMEPAAQKLEKHFEKISLSSLQIPYIANIDAKEYSAKTAPKVIQDNLIKQISGSVLWTQSISQLPSHTICLEVGPGQVLKGLVKKINPEIKVLSLDQKGSEESYSILEELLQ